jgi:hypothetical protein
LLGDVGVCGQLQRRALLAAVGRATVDILRKLSASLCSSRVRSSRPISPADGTTSSLSANVSATTATSWPAEAEGESTGIGGLALLRLRVGRLLLDFVGVCVRPPDGGVVCCLGPADVRHCSC